MNTDEANQFIENYRASLAEQQQAAQAQLAQQKENDYNQIMAGANKAGVMYSNFPERSKVQYESGTYLPAMAKTHSTYQTGLDKLRSNVVQYQNNIAALEKAIADLNSDYIISQNTY